MLELSSLQKAAERITVNQLHAMGVQVTAMLQKAQNGQAFAQEDREFHKILFSSTENIFLEQLLTSFWNLFENSSFNKPHEDLVEIAVLHQKQLEALVKHDVTTLREISESLAADSKYRILMDISLDGK